MNITYKRHIFQE